MLVAGTGGAASDLHAVRDRDHPHITHHPCDRARLKGNRWFGSRFSWVCGSVFRIWILPGRKKLTKKTRKNRKKELLNETKASLGYFMLLLELDIPLWRHKKKNVGIFILNN
jgi:hypothetical protein